METIRTGEICKTTGTYKCQTHPNHQIDMIKGKHVPPCDKHTPGHSTTWILVSKPHH